MKIAKEIDIPKGFPENGGIFMGANEKCKYCGEDCCEEIGANSKGRRGFHRDCNPGRLTKKEKEQGKL